MINGIENLTINQMIKELKSGGKIVRYKYTFSPIFFTYYRTSKKLFFISKGKSSFYKGIPFSIISLFTGWWSIPWGPIKTIQALIFNFKGGEDLTNEIILIMESKKEKNKGS